MFSRARRSLGTIAQYLDSDDKADIVSIFFPSSLFLLTMMQKAFQALLPSMINVIQQTLDAGDEPGARHVFDVFETLLILVRSVKSSVVFSARS